MFKIKELFTKGRILEREEEAFRFYKNKLILDFSFFIILINLICKTISSTSA